MKKIRKKQEKRETKVQVNRKSNDWVQFPTNATIAITKTIVISLSSCLCLTEAFEINKLGFKIKLEIIQRNFAPWSKT